MSARRRLTADNTFRSCSRCGKELTDPASREAGVGPVCRQKDNHLYAKLIPANIPMAGALVLGIKSDQLHEECSQRWLNVREEFIIKMAKVQQLNEDASIMRLTGADFREEVRDIDWILSYRQSPEMKSHLINVVRYLGYPGLAAVLSGEASKSKAKVWFENGRVFLQGTGCTPGWRKMKKIPGIKTPRYRGHKAPYSAPAAHAGDFFDVVIEHWPLHDEDLDTLRNQARQWSNNNPQLNNSANEEKPPQKNYLASISHRSEDFVLSFPWSNEHDTRGMITKLKKIPSNDRSYHPSTKNWLFKPQYLNTVRNIVNQHFPDCTVTHTNELTPNEQWKKFSHKSSRSRYTKSIRKPGYWHNDY